MTIEQIWESSRYNTYTLIHSIFIILVICLLVYLNNIDNVSKRRFYKNLSLFGLTFISLFTSGMHIGEKWNIRGAWAKEHWAQLNDIEKSAITADGANLLFGPLFHSFICFIIFSSVLLILKLCRRQQQNNL